MTKFIRKVVDGLLIMVGRQFAYVFHGTAYCCSICGPHRQKSCAFGSWFVVDDRHIYDNDIRCQCYFGITCSELAKNVY